jgi:hypothetical protein
VIERKIMGDNKKRQKKRQRMNINSEAWESGRRGRRRRVAHFCRTKVLKATCEWVL